MAALSSIPTESVPLIADHRRHRAGQRGGQVGVVVGHRIDHEPVDRGPGDPGDVLRSGAAGHQQQADLGLVALQGQALQKGDRPRVPDRVGGLFGQQ